MRIPPEAGNCLPKVLGTEYAIDRREIDLIRAAALGNVSVNNFAKELRQIKRAKDIFDEVRNGNILTHEGYNASVTPEGLEISTDTLADSGFWSSEDGELQLAAEQQGTTHYAYRQDVVWQDDRPHAPAHAICRAEVGRFGDDGVFESLMILPN